MPVENIPSPRASERWVRFRERLALLGCSILLLSPWFPVYPDVELEVCCRQPGRPVRWLASLTVREIRDLLLYAGIVFPHLWALLHALRRIVASGCGPSWILHALESGVSFGGLALAHVGAVLLVSREAPRLIEESAVPFPAFAAAAISFVGGVDLGGFLLWRRNRARGAPGTDPGALAALCCAAWFALWTSLAFADALLMRTLQEEGPVASGLGEFLVGFGGAFSGALLALAGSLLVFATLTGRSDPLRSGGPPTRLPT